MTQIELIKTKRRFASEHTMSADLQKQNGFCFSGTHQHSIHFVIRYQPYSISSGEVEPDPFDHYSVAVAEANEV